jgi:chorismate mutase
MKIAKFIDKKPFVIAGPCSAESQDQLLQIATNIKSSVDVFRAGVWKPRTLPNSFEGVGKLALGWLKKVKEETGLHVATEVATAKHVELCLESGIDMLWIGARTTVNPFYVQEIAEALSGVDIPIFVKNPIHPDLSLWIGALERLNNKGITKLSAIHRGFFTYESSAYRNEPKWELPIDLKRNLPDLPIICDPSHISGNTHLIEEITQIAMDLDMNGLMIETHNNPSEAWSDAKQQLTPKQLINILDKLVLRKKNFEDSNLNNELNFLREKIDILDSDLVEKLNLRTSLVKDIANLKLENNITIFQLDRWFQILEERKNQALRNSMDPKMVSDMFKLIHKYSILTQSKIMNK